MLAQMQDRANEDLDDAALEAQGAGAALPANRKVHMLAADCRGHRATSSLWLVASCSIASHVQYLACNLGLTSGCTARRCCHARHAMAGHAEKEQEQIAAARAAMRTKLLAIASEMSSGRHRQELQSSVFQASHNLPTITVEQAGAIELQQVRVDPGARSARALCLRGQHVRT